jgi:hypothetical protein
MRARHAQNKSEQAEEMQKKKSTGVQLTKYC